MTWNIRQRNEMLSKKFIRPNTLGAVDNVNFPQISQNIWTILKCIYDTIDAKMAADITRCSQQFSLVTTDDGSYWIFLLILQWTILESSTDCLFVCCLTVQRHTRVILVPTTLIEIKLLCLTNFFPHRLKSSSIVSK